jgi:alcohol dehydrogenase
MEESTIVLFQGTGESWLHQGIEVPVPNHGEILVRVLGCTICGSDLHSIHGRRQVATPSVLGHEIVGEIVAFGVDAVRLAVDGSELSMGDKITWSVVASCGDCYYCQHDLPQKCSMAVKYGHNRYELTSGPTGGFATHCLLVRGTRTVRIPDELPLEVVCPSSCATATIAAAMDAASIRAGDTVVVMGAGMLGLTACAMAAKMGCAHVICVDKSESRKELARSFGASQSLLPDQLSAVLTEATAGRGADVVLECTGSNAAFLDAMNGMRLGGRLVLVGAVFPQEPIPLVVESIVRRNLVLVGIHNYAPQHLVQAVQFLDLHWREFPFAKLVEQWYSLAHIEQAIAHAANPGAIRIGVRPT